VPHRPVDFHALGVDFAAFSSHKMTGPNGLGVLYGRRERLAQLPPARTGGSMIEVVTMESTTFMDPPTRFEAGTQAVPQVIGLAAACRYLEGVGMAAVAEHEESLGALMVERLSAIDGVTVIGDDASVPRSGLAAFIVDGVHSHDVSQFLDARGIAVRGGHHCAQPLHRRLGVTASTRASSYFTTTNDDIDALIAALGDVRAYFGADR
jgi:cysteine desulfurase/selenocysteine lyase